MKIHFDTPVEDVRIEIVPLIDVIFCILTFFILAVMGLTRQQAISVDLPQASTGVSQMRDMLIVSVDAVGQTYVEKELIFSREELRRRVVAYRTQQPSGLIVLYASKTSIYEDVVQILDLLRSVGGDRVALATLPGSGEQAPRPDATIPPYLDIPGLTPLPNNPVNPTAPPTSAPGQLPNNSTLTPGSPNALPTAPLPASPLPGGTPAPE